MHHRMAGVILVIMDILEIALRLMAETEIERLVVEVRIVSVARGCKIESASYIITIGAELDCDFLRQRLRPAIFAGLTCCSKVGSILERAWLPEDFRFRDTSLL